MHNVKTVVVTLAVLCCLLSLGVLSGCGGVGGPGGGSGTSGIPPKSTLTNPTEDATKPSAIGGSIFTMLPPPGQTPAMIDQAYQATVTLNRSDGGGTYYAQTQSTVRGGYNFANVPPGLYTVSASVQATNATSSVVSGMVINVRARGNIPTLMTNLLLGEATSKATISGTITQNGQPAASAVVSVDIKGYTPYYLEGTTDTVSVILSSTTDATGKYTFTVPTGALEYYIAAHNDTSAVSEMSAPITSLSPGQQQQVDLSLPAATAPTFTTITLDLLSCTLPNMSAGAASQALITRLAVARSRRAAPQRIARLVSRARALSASATPANLIENDLYWTLPSGGTEVSGYNVYRGLAASGPFTMVGAALDPYMFFFYDNDPGLQVGIPEYYTVCSFAADGTSSQAAVPILANPLPQVVVNGPADGAIVPVKSAVVSWTAVPGAQSYLVTKFNALPTFNILPVGASVTHTAADTAETLTGLAPGDYWWSVSAYDTADPNLAHAAAFTAYRKITLQ